MADETPKETVKEAVKEAPASRTQKFRAIYNVHATAGIVEPGGLVALTREEFDLLKAGGAIEGGWKDK